MMEERGFHWNVQRLEDAYFLQPALQDVKESRKMYPGLDEEDRDNLTFDLFSFKKGK